MSPRKRKTKNGSSPRKAKGSSTPVPSEQEQENTRRNIMMRSLLLFICLLAAAIVLFRVSASTNKSDEAECLPGDDDPNKECKVQPDATAAVPDDIPFITKVDPSLLQQAVRFKHFLQDIFDVNDSYKGTNRTEQELLVLQAVFERLELDASFLQHSGPPRTNWYLDFHQRLTALPPPDSFFDTYSDRPTDHQVQLVAAMDDKAVKMATTDYPDDDETPLADRLRQEGFRRHRHRGGTVRLQRMVQKILLDPIIHWTSFAVPNAQVLDRIAAYSPLIEMGAGTGYWTAVLRQRHGDNIDIVAYDTEPPDATAQNDYFHRSFTDILKGTCETAFSETSNGDRALLMVWPNNPDNVDQPDYFYSPNLPPVWDAQCLETYMAAGGTTVIFVGEREEKIKLIPNAPPESGMTATRQFQRMLKEHFQLVEQIDIPQWWTYDDATIWKRK